ncbi:MAG: hypothetical protein SFV55_08340 [Haliscomenobacter sp.]|uniref:hypothetical protein n=1 Tax=Haliscomenobacter sp. TaxID=2717303 RepID=UPI0029A89425|nr:hypothetical protein [Haliscomenobacter sp.]MDX2068421.1 hypothetical protein [Haliscomenobacter sp.]
MKSIIFILAWFGLMLSQINAQPVCPVVPRSTWFNPLQASLSTAGIRINNFTPRRHEFDPSGERAFWKPNDCFFRVDFGGTHYRLPFSLDMVAGGPDNRCKAYINEWNSSRTTVNTRGGRLIMSFNFESAETELITDCYNNACCEGNPFCPGAGCPDFELNSAWVEMQLLPILSGGRLRYSSEVIFKVDVRELGPDPCTNNFWAFLCDWGLIPRVGDRQNQIRRAIESNLRTKMDDPGLKAAIELALNNAIRSTGVDLSRCSSVQMDNAGNLIFR